MGSATYRKSVSPGQLDYVVHVGKNPTTQAAGAH